MEDYFGLIIFIIIVLFSLFGGKKKPRQPPAPPPRRPTQQREPRADARPEYTRPYREPPRPQPEPQPEASSAEDMVPADLWEILTGEKRVPGPSAERQPAGAPEPEPEPYYTYDEEPVHELPPPPIVREAPVRPEPVILERDFEAINERRERALQQRRAARVKQRAAQFADTTPAKAQIVERSALGKLLGNRDELKRAIVLREVLGPPKGMEP